MLRFGDEAAKAPQMSLIDFKPGEYYTMPISRSDIPLSVHDSGSQLTSCSFLLQSHHVQQIKGIGIDLAFAGDIDAENQMENKILIKKNVYKKIIFDGI